MKNKIIASSIECLQTYGLKFSVDLLAEKMQISKKTIYKHFSSKEELSLEIFKSFYTQLKNDIEKVMGEMVAYEDKIEKLLLLYFESTKMHNDELFNKYNLNENLKKFSEKQHNMVWKKLSSFLFYRKKREEIEIAKIIIDGSIKEAIKNGEDSSALEKNLKEMMW